MTVETYYILFLLTGVLLLAMGILAIKFLRVDPCEFNLLINEQAINLTSTYTPLNIRSMLYLD